MIRHKKVSTAPEAADPDKVGSQHWNDVHGYGPGAFIPVLVGEFEFAPPSVMYIMAGGPCYSSGSATNPSPGIFRIPINNLSADLKAASSLEVSYSGFITGLGAMPSAGWKWTLSIEDHSGWKVVLRHKGPDSEMANPTIKSIIYFSVYASLWEPS